MWLPLALISHAGNACTRYLVTQYVGKDPAMLAERAAKPSAFRLQLKAGVDDYGKCAGTYVILTGSDGAPKLLNGRAVYVGEGEISNRFMYADVISWGL